MARRVIKKDKGPYEVKPSQGSQWICMCGLSKNQPFCDGSHKAVQDEDDNTIYEYDESLNRKEVGKL